MGSQVQETNDFSIVSKLSMVSSGYFEDAYLQYLSPKYKRRSPLINIGYCVRAYVVNEGIQVFLKVTKNKYSQIVSLGAGFDTTYFRLFSELKNTCFFEVDFHEVVKNKIALIKKTLNLFNMLHEPKECNIGLHSKNYILIAQDMSNITELKEVLFNAGLEIKKPTLFLSECAITYMEADASRNIISWAASFEDVIFLIYEQISSGTGFSQVMLSHFESIDSPLKTVEKCPTKTEQVNRYTACGYQCAWSVGAFELFKKVLSQEKQKHILNLEPFDEWEEWHLTSSHYTLSAGTNGIFNNIYSELIAILNSTESDTTLTPCKWHFKRNSSLEFYGHSALFIWNSSAVLVVGGFGFSSDKKHKRLTQLCLISLPDFQVTCLDPPSIEDVCWDSMHHTCSILSDSDVETRFLLYGGRTSPVKSVNSIPFVITVSRKDPLNVTISGRRAHENSNESPHPRRRHSATNVNGATFICGGIWTDPKSFHQKVLNDMWIFKEDEMWKGLESNITARFSHSATSNNGVLYIVGGINENFEPLGDIWSYNISGKVWTNFERNIIPRYSHTSHYCKDCILLVGGVNDFSEKQPGITLINLLDKRIRTYELPKSTKDLPVMIHNHTSFLTPDSKELYIIGGGGNCFSFGTSFNKYPVVIRLDSIYN